MDQGAVVLLQLHLQHLRVLRYGLSLQADVLGVVGKKEARQSHGKSEHNEENDYLIIIT